MSFDLYAAHSAEWRSNLDPAHSAEGGYDLYTTHSSVAVGKMGLTGQAQSSAKNDCSIYIPPTQKPSGGQKDGVTDQAQSIEHRPLSRVAVAF